MVFVGSVGSFITPRVKTDERSVLDMTLFIAWAVRPARKLQLKVGIEIDRRYHSHMTSKLPQLIRKLDHRSCERLPDLGTREMLVLEVLWGLGHADAKAVQAGMPDDDISLSTVQSTLERLHRKSLLSREKQGRSYRYAANIDRTQLIGGLLRDMADQVADGNLAPMISGFIDYVSHEAPQLAGELSKSLAAPENDASGEKVTS